MKTFSNLQIIKFSNPSSGFVRSVFIICSLMFNVVNKGFSQEIEWQNTIGGSSSDYMYSLAKTSDGGYILGGKSGSGISFDKTENPRGGWDYWIVKIDSLGLVEWDKTIGGSSTDYLYSVQQTSDGGYILGGYSESDSSGDKTENCISNNYDYWIVKVDFLGVIQWQNTIGGAYWDYLMCVKQTVDGGYILGGHSSSYISGDKTAGCIGMDDYWIIKTDGFGNIQWQKTIGGNSDDHLVSIEQTADGGYIIGGTSASNISGNKSENCIGSSDYWIVKIDSFGTIQWQNTIGGSGIEYLNSIQQTMDGGYILGGESLSDISGDKTENCIGDLDYWIVKVDSIGAIQWQKTIGGDKHDYLSSIQQTSDEGYLLGGHSTSNIFHDKMENSIGVYDFWILKTDPLGNIEWQNTIGGNDSDVLTSIQQSGNGDFILGGWSSSNISGDKTENRYGTDYWIMKLTDKYNLITGTILADLNSNGVQDIGEPSLPGKKVTEQGTGRFSFSQTNGHFSVVVLDTGNYTVSTPSPIWYSSSPTVHSASFTAINQTDSLNDFVFQPIGSYEDVCVTITPLGNFRSGFNATYQINYGNYGTTTIAPTVYFFPDNDVTFYSASTTPSLIAPDSVLWNLPALTPFQTGSIIVTVLVNTGLPNGTLINSTAHIEPYLTDANPSCNNSNWEVYTTGAVDPNDIIVSEDTLTTTQLNTAPWLEYIIRFQNTGNDTAFTVKILNPIDTNKLDISSIEFVNASHPVNLNWINYQRNMEFKFDNILLPDSNVNEPLSHGFVRYRIQPKTTLNAGDTIPNFAAIYFDLNEPVITNTAKTVIVLPTGLTTTNPSPGKLLVFPNPAESSITISGIQLANGKAQLRLMDIYGKLILEKSINETTVNIETYQLAKGVYLIQSGSSRATFVKQ